MMMKAVFNHAVIAAVRSVDEYFAEISHVHRT